MTVLVASLAAAALIAMPDGSAQQPSVDRWIIEPGPEAKDAAKLGASEVERAQKLAKAGQTYDAALALEALSRKLPAAVHDCNLALAYLRGSRLTAAKLLWDLSGLRNGTRPKWCTGEVSTQLSDALRGANFVPTTIVVVPPDAVIEVGGIALRNIQTVWLPPSPTSITASKPGFVTKTEPVTITAPSTRVTITLEAPPPVQPVADAGVEAVPQDAAPLVTAPPVDAAPVTATPQPDPFITIGGTPVGYRYGALSLAVVGWIGAGVFGVLTYNAKDDADELYTTDPAFDDKRDQYNTMKWATVGSIGVGAVATALTIYYFMREDRVIPAPGRIQVGFGEGSFGVSVQGSFGGGR